MYFNGEFYFGKARGHKLAKSCEIYTRDGKGPVSLLLSFSDFYVALDQLPLLLKIGEIGENGKTWKMTNLQKGFWSLEHRKIVSLCVT